MSISTNDNLPIPLSAFIGRVHEIAEVRQLLIDHRLVMLTGAGGSGKTRLSLKVAKELTGEFEDGIWFVELASITNPALVPQTIASILNIHEQPGHSVMDVIINHLSMHAILLVIDNCEHVVSACAQFADAVLQKCPNLKILATSRETLGITGEIVWTVPPLSLPMQQPSTYSASVQDDLSLYKESESIQLFVTRAAENSPGFQLTAQNAALVEKICCHLDGMPLAIELAAARLRSLSVQQIAQKLDDRFHLLTGGSRTAPLRQQTLEATLDWSYALLSPSEQKVLQRLSIFAGGATMEAVEWICSDMRESVLDVLSHLVNKSLITATSYEHGEMRYHLLETIRQYAREKLVEAGEMDEIKTRHLNYFAQWTKLVTDKVDESNTHHLNYFIQWTERAEPSEPSLNVSDQVLWLKRFETDHDNLRAALEWSLLDENRVETGLQLAAITAVFWKMHGHYGEGRARLNAALAHQAAQGQTLVRAQTLLRASVLAFYQSDYPAVQALAEESLLISRKQGPAGRLMVADAIEMLAEAASETGDYPTATKLYEEALPLYREIGDLAGVGDTLKMLGWGAMRTGNYELAESLLNEGLVVCRQSGDLHQIVSTLSGLGELAIRREQYARAQSLLQESLDLNQRVGEKWELAIAVGSLGWVALRQHDFREMSRLLGESLNIRMETGDKGGIAWCLEKLAEASGLQSHFERAVIIFGAAAALRAPVGSVMDAADQLDYERMISNLRSSLGEEAFTEAWNEGQVMTLDQAIDYALAEPEPQESEVSLKEKFGGLTAREREAAKLIAQGKSNREIAKAMTVGSKTVETYVTRILNKLGFDSRVQIATWVIEKGLDIKES